MLEIFIGKALIFLRNFLFVLYDGCVWFFVFQPNSLVFFFFDNLLEATHNL